MTDEHKRKISKSNKGKHSDKIWITNGEINKKIFPQELLEYASLGFYKGRYISTPPWNKGLTKDDPRVQKYLENRKK